MLTRRALLMGTAASAFAPGLAAAQASRTGRQAAMNAALLRPDTLAYFAAKSGLLFGSMFGSGELGDAAYTREVIRECSLIYPYDLGPRNTRRSQSGFNFSTADRLVSFANGNNLAVGGGYLVVHGSEPPWITPATDRSTALTELQTIVTETMTHYLGQLDHWIVVNEAIDVASKSPFALRNCTWLSTVGTDYVAQAFVAARRADPKAVLVLNEYGIEADNPDDERKRAAVLALLRALKSSNVPIDALGIQAHIWGERHMTSGALDTFLNDVHALGLKIVVTELDVIDANLPADSGARDAAVAQGLGAFLNVVLHHPGVTSINVWGLSDSHSWYNRSATPASMRRKDGRTSRAALLDQDLGRKPGYSALRAALGG